MQHGSYIYSEKKWIQLAVVHLMISDLINSFTPNIHLQNTY